MAYNHGREDRKWRIWKEAEEKLLRECGVDEVTIEQIRMSGTLRITRKTVIFGARTA